MLSASVELMLHGSTLTLQARDASLYDILTAFAAYGITVDAQPGIRSRFNGVLTEKGIDDALDQILQHHPHNTTWREIPYGRGFLRVLSGIQVYAPGPAGQDPMQRIAPGPRRILALPTGEAYLADEVLLGVRPGGDAERFRRLLANMGGQIISADSQTGIYRVRLPQNTNLPALLNQLAQNDLIAVAEPNFVYPALPPHGQETLTAGSPAPPTALRPPAPGHPALAIIDSGLDPRRLPEDILRASRDVTGANLPLEDPVGHGTHMALIAAGLSATPGHAPGGGAVPLVSIRGFDPDGNTHSFGILESLTFAAESGARVISMSWGAYTESAVLGHAFQQAADQGLILLASAGNDGRNQLMFPAAYPSVLSVGAAAPNGTREPYSNYAPGLDLLAPGTALLTDGDLQTVLRGTSMATPWVAAALTAYLHQHPEATAEDAVAQLRTALRFTDSSGNETPGLFDEEARARFLGSGAND
ncbi:MAG: S8 family serine peptidase [Verrucomicrobia bacterium]|nr:S8 family serine peptidase [Verrucomicrobiota bacterium]MCH8525740.1 S8 family serine peptidase [Kiritimatiellia bacterium]